MIHINSISLSKLEKTTKQVRILVAPLNWGLGHAARCIPIIRALQAREGVEVLLASDGRAFELLKREFPSLKVVELPAYDIKYQAAGGAFEWEMMKQVPKILRAINKERRLVERLVKEERIDVIISDNRFGCRSGRAFNVFMTHQVFMLLPPSLKLLSSTLLKLNKGYIDKFDLCWIPDFEEVERNLSGHLSHAQKLNSKRYRFIGPLSRMGVQQEAEAATAVVEDSAIKRLLSVLSGPEPQRGIFEAELLAQLDDSYFAKQFQVVLVRGVTESDAHSTPLPHVECFDHMTSGALEAALRKADIILSRAGYSTVMDMAALRKKAILIPTPGQTEQEYLTEHLADSSIFYCCSQEELVLRTAVDGLMGLENVEGVWFDYSSSVLEAAIDDLIVRIKGKR